jgi:hypothetical protein
MGNDRVETSCLSEQDIADFNEYLSFVGFDCGRKSEEDAETGQNIDYVRSALMKEVARIFYKGEKQPFGEKQIARRLQEYMEVVKAKVQQLRDVPSDFMERQIRRRADFYAESRTLLKTMQELLSAETEQQSFSREDIKNKGQSALVRNIIIDPRKITNTILRNLGLEEFIPKGRRLSPAERIKRRAEAIPQIKEIFSGDVEPIQYSHEIRKHPSEYSFFRLLRIRNGKNEGFVLGTQKNDDHKVPFLTDLHGAVRRVDHIEDSYDKEMASLKEIQGILEEISQKVTSNWRKVKETGLDDICKKLVGIVESLKSSKNKQKKQIRDQIERCLTFKDSTGRINPYSRLAILSTVREFIDSRISETAKIMSYLGQDRVRILTVIFDQSCALAQFTREVEGHTDRLALLNPEQKLDGARRQKILRNLGALRAQCQKFLFAPYLGLSKKLLEEIDSIIQLLNSGDFDDVEKRESAKKSFVRVYVVSKLFRVDNEIVELRRRFFPPGRDFEKIYAKGFKLAVSGMEKRFKSKSIAPDVDISEFKDVFGRLYKFLGEIRILASQSLGEGKTPEDRVTAMREIDRMLKEFDLYEGV